MCGISERIIIIIIKISSSIAAKDLACAAERRREEKRPQEKEIRSSCKSFVRHACIRRPSPLRSRANAATTVCPLSIRLPIPLFHLQVGQKTVKSVRTYNCPTFQANISLVDPVPLAQPAPTFNSIVRASSHTFLVGSVVPCTSVGQDVLQFRRSQVGIHTSLCFWLSGSSAPARTTRWSHSGESVRPSRRQGAGFRLETLARPSRPLFSSRIFPS